MWLHGTALILQGISLIRRGKQLSNHASDLILNMELWPQPRFSRVKSRNLNTDGMRPLLVITVSVGLQKASVLFGFIRQLFPPCKQNIHGATKWVYCSFVYLSTRASGTFTALLAQECSVTTRVFERTSCCCKCGCIDACKRVLINSKICMYMLQQEVCLGCLI